MKSINILFLILFGFLGKAFSQENPKVFNNFVYCDTIINKGLYQAIMVDSLLYNIYPLGIITYSVLQKYFEKDDYSQIKILLKNGEEITSTDFILNERSIICKIGPIEIDSLVQLKFIESGSILDATLGAGYGFLAGGMIALIYEVLDSLIGPDKIETEQVLIVGGAGSVLGVFLGSIDRSIKIKFSKK